MNLSKLTRREAIQAGLGLGTLLITLGPKEARASGSWSQSTSTAGGGASSDSGGDSGQDESWPLFSVHDSSDWANAHPFTMSWHQRNLEYQKLEKSAAELRKYGSFGNIGRR